MVKRGYDYGVRIVARHTGLTGVQAKQIVMQLRKRNIAFDIIDWETIGQEARDYGDRYNAVWNKIREMYGIDRRVFHEHRYQQHKEPLSGESLQMEMCLTRHRGRSRLSQAVDESLKATKVFIVSDIKGVRKWMQNPRRYDIVNVDWFGRFGKTRKAKKRKH